MINLLVDIPMNDEVLDPPMQAGRLLYVAVLNGDPDDLFQFVEADGREDRQGFVIGVGRAGQRVVDAVLDCQRDFVGGVGERVLVCGGGLRGAGIC